MAPSFGRSISFPLTPGRSSSKPHHVRSVSLPASTTSSHPLLAHLKAQIAVVRSLSHSSVTASLTHIHALHSSISDILLLQDSQDALRRATNLGDRLLDAFLLLADAHQGFQACLLDLKLAMAETSAALRRGDAARAASAMRSQRRAEKELARLAMSVSAKSARLNFADTKDAEMAGALLEAAATSVAVSAAVFMAAASMSSESSPSSSNKIISVFGSFGKKKVTPETAELALERMQALEQCFDECDGVCDKVFRSIVQTRVSLLNIMAPII